MERRNRIRAGVSLFFVAGAVFIIASVISRKVGIFLPIGVAMIVIGMGAQKRIQR
jgi:membrane-bound ClpP family serine protease